MTFRMLSAGEGMVWYHWPGELEILDQVKLGHNEFAVPRWG